MKRMCEREILIFGVIKREGERGRERERERREKYKNIVS